MSRPYYITSGLDQMQMPFMDETETPLTKQVGGEHYKNYKIQPIEYAMANKLNYCQSNAIKYITRYRDKNGKEDLLKAIHNIEILLELEYGEQGYQRVRGKAKTSPAPTQPYSTGPGFTQVSVARNPDQTTI